jgi:hypothetical protein
MMSGISYALDSNPVSLGTNNNEPFILYIACKHDCPWGKKEGGRD